MKWKFPGCTDGNEWLSTGGGGCHLFPTLCRQRQWEQEFKVSSNYQDGVRVPWTRGALVTTTTTTIITTTTTSQHPDNYNKTWTRQFKLLISELFYQLVNHNPWRIQTDLVNKPMSLMSEYHWTLNGFICLCVCVCRYMWRWHLAGIGSFLLPCRFWRLNFYH